MKMEFVILHLGEQRLESIFSDEKGQRKKVSFKWFEKDASNVPPKVWAEAVCTEAQAARVRRMGSPDYIKRNL